MFQLRKQPKDNMRWHFPALDHGESEGYNDPLLQYFEGDYAQNVAREVIQNSIDARSNPQQPVSIVFEKLMVPMKEVPGIGELSQRLEVCLAKARKQKRDKAEDYFKNACDTVSGKALCILRASDYNSTGLTGSDEDIDGKWHKLVKAIGDNEMSGAGGGSFGIGKGAPFAASLLRTVYYSTLNEEGEYIFQGKTRLLSHDWESKEMRGVGFYGINGYGSVRKLNEIPRLFRRTEQGTDINILGYNGTGEWMADLAKSVLDNFWMAVHAGDLEVAIKNGGEEVLINKSTLYEKLLQFSSDNGLFYYRAVISPTTVVRASLPLLGSCQLFIKLEEKFPKDIELMRKPKMVVKKRSFRTLQDSYAGVFVCDDDSGNRILRGMEPPEHNEWDEKRDRENGKKAWTELKEWIIGVLKELAATEGGDPEDIPGLDEFLPYDEDAEMMAESNVKSRPSGKAASEETGNEVGAERDEIEDEIEDYVRRPSMLRRTKDKGGSGGGSVGGGGGSGGGGNGGGNEEGEGLDRIPTSSIRCRIIYAGSKDGRAEYCLLIEPLSDQEGSLNIVAVGEDSAVYSVPLAFASSWKGKGAYPVSGSFVEGLKLKKGEEIKVRLGLKSNSRYALGVENYEG